MVYLLFLVVVCMLIDDYIYSMSFIYYFLLCREDSSKPRRFATQPLRNWISQVG